MSQEAEQVWEQEIPQDVIFTLHLDINKGGDWVYGCCSIQPPYPVRCVTVRLSDLPDKDHYYAPALVMYNQKQAVEVRCDINGKTVYLREGIDLFRTFARSLAGQTGTFTATWYYNGIKVDDFTWVVE